MASTSLRESHRQRFSVVLYTSVRAAAEIAVNRGQLLRVSWGLVGYRQKSALKERVLTWQPDAIIYLCDMKQ